MSLAVTLRRAVVTIGVVLAVAFAAYAIYWHVMAGRLREGLAPWVAARQAEGEELHWSQVEIGGFPTRFRFRFTDARFAAARPVPIAFTAARLDVWAEPWNLDHWRFSSGDVAKVEDPLGAVGVDLDYIEGSARLGADTPLVLDLAVAGAKGSGLVQGFTIARATAHIEIPPARPRSHLDTTMSAAIELRQVGLPTKMTGFGDVVSDLAFSTDLKGALPPGPLAPALASWRDAGGTLELRYFRLRWSGLLIDANGTLALDDALQPEGALSAEITGQDAAVDLAVTSGTLQPADAALAKAVLGLLAKPGPNGEKAITVPLTLQQDRLYLAGARIAEIPRIDWN